MLLVLTPREDFRALGVELAKDLGHTFYWARSFVEATTKRPINAREDTFYVVDLSDPTIRSGSVRLVVELQREFPWASFLYLCPMEECAMEAALALDHCGRGSTLFGAHVLKSDSWRAALTRGSRIRLQGEMLEDLAAAARRLQRKLPDRLAPVLQAAPNAPNAADYCRIIEERRGLFSRIRRRRQVDAKALLHAARLLWWMRLTNDGWRPWDIARFLSLEDSTALANSLRRIWGVGPKELRRIEYDAFVTMLAKWVSTEGLIGRSDLRQQLQNELTQ